MEVIYEVERDPSGRITRVRYKNDRAEDPDGRTQIEVLEFLNIVEKGELLVKEDER